MVVPPTCSGVEIAVTVPKRRLRSATEAFDFGYDCAVLYIDAEDHRGA